MSDIEQRLCEAYDAQTLPDAVRAQTLDAIEGMRAEAAPPRSKPARRLRLYKRASLAVAACLALCAALFGAFSVYTTPSAYVDIEVNPSIELTVNPFGAVIGVQALNADAEQLLQSGSVVNMPYEEALSALMTCLQDSSFLDEGAYVDITVISNDQALSSRLIRTSDQTLEGNPYQHSCHHADSAVHAAAAQAGLGVGRYQAALELIELDPAYSMQDCASMSMREIRAHIAECRGEESSNETACENEGGCGSGHGQGSHGQGTRRGHDTAH